MGDLWRSEEMQLIQLYIQIDAAHDTVDELGKLGCIQFRDLNPHVNAFQRNFVNEVKRADEMLRKLNTFTNQIESYNNDAEEIFQPLITINENDLEPKLHMDELEANFSDLEQQISELSTHQEQLNRNHHQLVEISHVLNFSESTREQKGQLEIGEEEVIQDDDGTSLITEEGRFQVKFGSITGIIRSEKFPSFEKILFRATRGNLFLKHKEIERPIKDPIDGKSQKKTVFVVFYQGERLGTKITKICESMAVNVYQCPETQAERRKLLEQVQSRLETLAVLLDKGWDKRTQILTNIAQHLFFWRTRVMREKMIYHTMNKFNYDLGRRCLIAEGWCPIASTENIHIALRTGRERSGAPIPSVLDIVKTNEQPPTHFNCNIVTQGFQDIVDSYGVARYREINPAVFTIVTFPFEFGIMFGDVGHGGLLLIFAAWLIYMERHWEGKKINEMIEMCYKGRYTIFLMALWSVYIGSLYNEFFAISVNAGSNYKLEHGPNFNNNTFAKINPNWTYPWGVDPIWKGSSNELLFYNSLKMKSAVIFGIIQMTLGLIIKLLNGIHFRNLLDIYFEFIPRILFLWATFGYLLLLIFIKWNTDYVYPTLRVSTSPQLLNQLIGMFLGGVNITEANEIYPHQAGTQNVLYVVAIICVPWMLIPKPLILHLQHNAKERGLPSIWDLFSSRAAVPRVDHEAQEEHHGGHGAGAHDEEHDVSEIWVHQGLETIEFVLGCISHTASYLRLWALSLAHSELATVFYDKIVAEMWESESLFVLTIMSFLTVSIWMATTIFIIMMMEVLSAFLHALRLHWVEFQSKFYFGDGYAFKPFKYTKFMEVEDE